MTSKYIKGVEKNRKSSIIRRMIVWLTKRLIIKELQRIRWKTNNPIYKDKGVPFRVFSEKVADKHLIGEIGNKIFKVLFPIIHCIDRNYVLDYEYRIDEALEDCIEDKYIQNRDGYLRVSSKGKRVLSFWCNLSEFLKHPFILRLIPVGSLTYIILELLKAFNIL